MSAPADRAPAGVTTALPGLLTLLVGCVLATQEGGFGASDFSLAGLFLLALLVLVLVVAPPERWERSRVTEAALLLLAAFTVWSFASMLWADAPGPAWEGSNRALLYVLAVALVALRPWSPRAAHVGFGVVAFGIGLLALGVLLRTSLVDDPTRLFLGGRLAQPIDYTNATANLWLIAFFPAIHLAVAREVPWAVRGLALGAASLLLQTALLSQSRGAAIGFGVAVVVYIALAPRRWPALLALGAIAALAMTNWTALAEVRTAPTPEALAHALADARSAIFVCALSAVAVGALAALAGRWTPPGLRTRNARRGGDVAIAAIAIALVVAAGVAIGNPSQWLDDRWHDFKTSGYTPVETSANRLTSGSIGSNRYDFWRVALNEFANQPIRGIGTDNYAFPYLRQRRSGEAPRHPHSLVFRLLAQNGLVGTALVAGFVALLLVGAARVRRALGDEGRSVVAAGVGGFAAWFVHGLADWLWEFPALSVLALALLAIAVRVRDADRGGETAEPLVAEPVGDRVVGRRRGAPPVAALALLGLLAGLSFALAGTAARFTAAAYSAVDARKSLDRLDRAAAFNPFSADPLIAEGIISRRLGDHARARRAFLDAREREPTNWLVPFELALVEATAGERAQAIRYAQLAQRQNPRQPVVKELLEMLRAGSRIDAEDLEGRLAGQIRFRLEPTWEE